MTTYQIERLHNVKGRSCTDCLLYLDSIPADSSGPVWVTERSNLAHIHAANYLFAHRPSHCHHLRAVSDSGDILDRTTFPKPTISLLIQPCDESRGLNLPGIGYWKSDAYPFYPDPHDYIRTDASPDLIHDLTTKLRAGRVIGRYRGYHYCRICNVQAGSAVMTNGVYVYPEGLIHYVEEHRVIVPL